ncbi:hypothetical protein RN001_000308 [Aquatica leii]|uniref:Vesicular, overexpressed in cancer, prosurvival protein 1 n=1 Tax=Aquatica leii TaxID=1421715 RepID=A0AAN7PEP5_9COLE|nr:hypothetical protein RN001_000308 [Aquatica leii]
MLYKWMLGFCCLRFCAKKKQERSVLYKRSTSLQNPQNQSSPITQTFRYSLSESRPVSATPPYPISITPYPPQPPPIGFGLMPAYEASTSIAYPMIHTPRSDTINETNTQPPYPPFNVAPYPPPLPPTYDEAMRHSTYLGR